MNFLFVAGCPRSGTTAVADLLNTDDRILIGRERFKYVPDRIVPRDFTADRFLRPTAGETNFIDPAYFQEARAKFESGRLAYIGDKMPRYTMRLQRLHACFPDVRFVVMHRDLVQVAASFERRARDPKDSWPISNDYRVAIRHWHAAIRGLRRYAHVYGLDSLLVIDFEIYVEQGVRQLQRVYRFLGIEVPEYTFQIHSERSQAWFQSRSLPDEVLTESQREEIALARDSKLDVWMKSLATR